MLRRGGSGHSPLMTPQSSCLRNRAEPRPPRRPPDGRRGRRRRNEWSLLYPSADGGRQIGDCPERIVVRRMRGGQPAQRVEKWPPARAVRAPRTDRRLRDAASAPRRTQQDRAAAARPDAVRRAAPGCRLSPAPPPEAGASRRPDPPPCPPGAGVAKVSRVLNPRSSAPISCRVTVKSKCGDRAMRRARRASNCWPPDPRPDPARPLSLGRQRQRIRDLERDPGRAESVVGEVQVRQRLL